MTIVVIALIAIVADADLSWSCFHTIAIRQTTLKTHENKLNYCTWQLHTVPRCTADQEGVGLLPYRSCSMVLWSLDQSIWTCVV